MLRRSLLSPSRCGLAFVVILLGTASAQSGNPNFHNVPSSAKSKKNPYEGQANAQAAGKMLYAHDCSRCHGQNAEGSGNIPALVDGTLESVTPGELFWFITKGDV